ncbi:MAG: alginate export family protein [Steroidobacteraceae bacterium]
MTRLLMMKKTTKLTLAMAAIAACNAAIANPVTSAFSESKPIIDLRLRYETVDQEPFVNDATATTARARLGFDTGKAWNTSLLLEGEFVGALQDDYNSTTNGKTTYPVVVDPKVTQFNRFQLTNTSITGTTITLGRQRINIDDQRFIGNVGWRQNEQTLDALRVVTKPGGVLTLDATYSNRVNRIFGEDSIQGVYKGDFIFLNAAYPFAVGKLTAFGYFMDIDPIVGVAAAVRDSTSTLGLRFAGQQNIGKVKVTYSASYATQKDYADNPLDFSNDYYLAEAGVTFRQWSAGLGVENLDGNGTKGFTTPLATLHKFQGWADKFLTTPVNGINDKYLNAGFATKGVGPFETVALTAAYHTFDSTRLSQDLGSEIDLQVTAKWRRFTGLVKYADYSANNTTPAAYSDTKKFWTEIGFVW